MDATTSSNILSDENVIVLEVRCFEPGCVPIETVIMLSPIETTGTSGATRSTFKILKPSKEVTKADVSETFKTVLESEATNDSTSDSPLKDTTGTESVGHAVNCPCCDPYSDYVAGRYGFCEICL